MAAMSETNRFRCWAQYIRAEASLPQGITKADVRAAVDAADTWADDNQASFNTALPTAFKNAASTTQKTILLMYVLMRRAGRLHAEEDG